MSLELPERFCVDDADRVLAEIRAAAADGHVLQIDLSGVTSVDTAALQLLLAVKQDLQRRGGDCLFTGTPEVLLERARLLGIAHRLELA